MPPTEEAARSAGRRDQFKPFSHLIILQATEMLLRTLSALRATSLVRGSYSIVTSTRLKDLAPLSGELSPQATEVCDAAALTLSSRTGLS